MTLRDMRNQGIADRMTGSFVDLLANMNRLDALESDDAINSESREVIRVYGEIKAASERLLVIAAAQRARGMSGTLAERVLDVLGDAQLRIEEEAQEIVL